MTNQTLTQERLKYLLTYDSVSGIFTRNTTDRNNCKKCKIGETAGTLSSLGYYTTVIDGKSYPLHRLVSLYMYGSLPIKLIDHINHITTDNRLCNLREATHTENVRNRKKQKNNTSGFRGVHFDKSKGVFVARCNSKHLGQFNTAEEASLAYEEYAKRINGRFYHILKEE